MPVCISASVLNSDLSRLGEEVKRVDICGADMIHIDVMDGAFVPAITYGAAVMKSVRCCSNKLFDVHLMVDKPINKIRDFALSGADIITFHLEAAENPSEVIDLIHSYGIKAGISIKPSTTASEVFPYMEKADMVLVMTVEPGKGGQGFIPTTLTSVKEVSAKSKELGKELMIEVDGGINEKTAPLVREAGANVLVAGTYLFKSENMAEAVKLLR